MDLNSLLECILFILRLMMKMCYEYINYKIWFFKKEKLHDLNHMYMIEHV